jgi:hypothetical protein
MPCAFARTPTRSPLISEPSPDTARPACEAVSSSTRDTELPRFARAPAMSSPVIVVVPLVWIVSFAVSPNGSSVTVGAVPV